MPADAISSTDAGPMILARLRAPGRIPAEVLAAVTDPALPANAIDRSRLLDYDFLPWVQRCATDC